MATHEFDNELEVAVSGSETEVNDSIKTTLANKFKSPSAEVFAESHAECRGLGWGGRTLAECVYAEQLGMPRND